MTGCSSAYGWTCINMNEYSTINKYTSLMRRSSLHVQLEIRSGMALTFQNTNGSLGSGTLTSSGTYLTTANFTGNGNFDTVVVPTVSSTSGCGSYTNQSIQLAVLVLSLDASVSTCGCPGPN